jgi:protein ImuA
MPIPLLRDRLDPIRQSQPLAPGISLLRGRLHEVCGPARRSFAALVMAQTEGPVLWLHPAWQAERLFPAGLAQFADPARVILVTARHPEELLWAAEEALRSGAIPLVIADLTEPPTLTRVRRLHLSAETGAEVQGRTRPAPLGLMLTPGDGGAPGVETRWRLTPERAPGPGLAADSGRPRHWRIDRLRDRLAPPASWRLTGQTSGTLEVQKL